MTIYNAYLQVRESPRERRRKKFERGKKRRNFLSKCSFPVIVRPAVLGSVIRTSFCFNIYTRKSKDEREKVLLPTVYLFFLLPPERTTLYILDNYM
jgi:hypothetical protein